MVFAGGCLCDAVRFEAEGPSLFVAHCHCRWCRRAHGAAFVTWLGVREDRFRIAAGTEALTWYVSSTTSRRAFCGRCGTTMLYATDVAPGEVHIARALIEGAVDKEPQGHVFIDHAVAWITLGDDLPRWNSAEPGLAKYAAVPALERRSEPTGST